jgi:hypothetical protein
MKKFKTVKEDLSHEQNEDILLPPISSRKKSSQRLNNSSLSSVPSGDMLDEEGIDNQSLNKLFQEPHEMHKVLINITME